VLLVPREMKVEHTQGIASLTDEQIETAIAAIREMLDQREKALAGEVIEGKAEPVALPASGQQGERVVSRPESGRAAATQGGTT
jgi:hypothetical protein